MAFEASRPGERGHAAGESLADVVADEVVAQSLGASTTVSRWDEIEVELTGGSPELLRATDRRLREAGLRAAGRATKLERALPADLPAPRGTGGLTPRSPAGDVVLGYLAAQTARLTSLDVVLSRHLLAGLAVTPAELVMGPAQARIRAHFAPQQAAARAAVLQALDSTAYFAMLDGLERLFADPPLTSTAARPAGKVLPGAVARSYRRTSRRMRRALRAPAGPARDAALHTARKAAKRTRYAAEAARPASGKNARRLAKRMKTVQSVLGDHPGHARQGSPLADLTTGNWPSPFSTAA